jgi:hypothetical protein
VSVLKILQVDLVDTRSVVTVRWIRSPSGGEDPRGKELTEEARVAAFRPTAIEPSSLLASIEGLLTSFSRYQAQLPFQTQPFKRIVLETWDFGAIYRRAAYEVTIVARNAPFISKLLRTASLLC